MDTGFIDLDILLTRIRHEQSRIYLQDAVKAYKAGALRASMTAVWVALVFDLIAKYRELVAMSDPAATAFLSSLDAATATGDIRKLLQLEASIIDDATQNTQVVNQIAGTHLERLRADRHLCAHPAFSAEAELFEPSAELVRLHLVNVVTLVLSQEPRQGKAIFDLFDIDVQSPGFPTAHTKILDYVEQRYLERVRPQNIRNFGTVLAKSLLKGTPAQWDSQREKIVSSLVAVRERAPTAWVDISVAIVRIMDNLEPVDRSRAIAFVAAFPDFWLLLKPATRTALQQTVENVEAATLDDYLILEGVTVPHFRDALLRTISNLNREQLSNAIDARPRLELWPPALEIYRRSGGWRGSESNFRELVAPFAGRLSSQQLDQLLDAIVENGQNWDAAETDTLLISALKDSKLENLPTFASRDRFYNHVRRVDRLEKYEELIAFLQVDGWVVPQAAQENHDDNQD